MRIGRPAGFSVRKRWMSRLRKRRSYGNPCAAPVLSGDIEVLMVRGLWLTGGWNSVWKGPFYGCYGNRNAFRGPESCKRGACGIPCSASGLGMGGAGRRFHSLAIGKMPELRFLKIFLEETEPPSFLHGFVRNREAVRFYE